MAYRVETVGLYDGVGGCFGAVREVRILSPWSEVQSFRHR
jgi:hypothetical protein